MESSRQLEDWRIGIAGLDGGYSSLMMMMMMMMVNGRKRMSQANGIIGIIWRMVRRDQ